MLLGREGCPLLTRELSDVGEDIYIDIKVNTFTIQRPVPNPFCFTCSLKFLTLSGVQSSFFSVGTTLYFLNFAEVKILLLTTFCLLQHFLKYFAGLWWLYLSLWDPLKRYFLEKFLPILGLGREKRWIPMLDLVSSLRKFWSWQITLEIYLKNRSNIGSPVVLHFSVLRGFLGCGNFSVKIGKGQTTQNTIPSWNVILRNRPSFLSGKTFVLKYFPYVQLSLTIIYW